MTTESPCVRACTFDGKVCRGCGRTMEEIANWQFMTDEQKIETNERIRRINARTDTPAE